MTLSRRVALAAPFLLGGTAARAQDNTTARGQGAAASGSGGFPSKPVRMVVPYSPGGVSDISARLMAEPLASHWGQPVPVENRAGADGILGSDVIARSAPDGHVLGVVSVGHPVNAAFYCLPYDTMRDFSFVTMLTRTPLVLCAGPGFAPRDPAELVALAKTRPAGDLTYAAAGGVVRLAPLLFAQRTGLRMTGVTYRGSTQAHPDLMAGRVDVMFDTVPAALAHIRTGALRALATTGPRRAPQLPDVPTMAEALLPGFEAQTWGMVIGPANIPAPLLARLSADCAAAITRPEVVERHRALGAEVGTSTPEETRRFVQAELDKWGEAARLAGIEPGAPT